MAVTLHDEVVEARSAWGRQMASSLANVSFFTAWFSVIASMTRSQSLRSSRWTDPLSRPRVSFLARSSILALATRLSRLLRNPPRPLSRNAWLASMTTVGKPAWADTCAMPEPMSPHPITPTCLMAMPERPPWTICGLWRSRRRWGPSVVADQGFDAVSLQPLPSLEKGQLDQEIAGHDDSTQPLDEAQGGRHCPSRGEQVVHRENALTAGDGVLMNGEDVPAVLELVLLLDHRTGKLALLPYRHEAGAQLLGERPAEDEAPRFDAHHHVHLGRAVPGGQMVDHRGPRGPVLQQRGDVLEEDALGREVLDIADFCGERGDVHDGRRCYLLAPFDATRKPAQANRRSTRCRRSVTTTSAWMAGGRPPAAR